MVPAPFTEEEQGSEKLLQLPEATQQGGRQANSAFDMEIEAQRAANCSVTACEQIPAGLSLFPKHQGKKQLRFSS